MWKCRKIPKKTSMGKCTFTGFSDYSPAILVKMLLWNFARFSEKIIFQNTSWALLLSFERPSARVKFAFTKTIHSVATNYNSINISYNQKHITNSLYMLQYSKVLLCSRYFSQQENFEDNNWNYRLTAD